MPNSLASLLDNSVITLLLNTILDKLDKQPTAQRTRKITLKVDKKNFPQLFEGDEFIEEKIDALLKFSIFELKVAPKKRFLPLVEQDAKLLFNSQCETMLREHYHRTVQSSEWMNALEQCDFSFDNKLKNILLQKPIQIEGKNAYEIVVRVIEWAKTPHKSHSAREESARCFWGISKIFDSNSQEALRRHFDLELMPISLLIHSHNNSIDKILFIENLETFYQASSSDNQVFENTLLIYSSGYKASAKRVRSPNGSKMFFSPNSHLSDEMRLNFILWFYGKIESNIFIYFWGDLDYSAMHILKALKTNFPTIDAWKLGYTKMVQSLENGFGHTPNMAKKEKQYPIKDLLGCSYADRVLIPLMQRKNLFLDQEFVDIENLS